MAGIGDRCRRHHSARGDRQRLLVLEGGIGDEIEAKAVGEPPDFAIILGDVIGANIEIPGQVAARLGEGKGFAHAADAVGLFKDGDRITPRAQQPGHGDARRPRADDADVAHALAAFSTKVPCSP